MPIARIQSTAAPSPIASAICEVPASNFHGRSVQVDSLARDGADHVAAADERRHLLEQLAPAVQHPDPGRPVGLVPGPGVEVDVELAEIHRHLRHRLGAVDEHQRARRVRAARDLRDRVDRPEHVRDVDHADQLRLALEQRVERVEVELAVVQHRHVRELGLPVLAEDLPRDDVRVVLHLGQHDEVAALTFCRPQRVRDEVDRGGRVGGEDRLLGRRAEPLGDPLARALVQVGRLDRERVDAAVDRRPVLGVVPGHRIDHRLRRLRGRGSSRGRRAAAVPAQDRELRGDVRRRRSRSSPTALTPLRRPPRRSSRSPSPRARSPGPGRPA